MLTTLESWSSLLRSNFPTLQDDFTRSSRHYIADGVNWIRVDKDTNMSDVEHNKRRERQLYDTCLAILDKHGEDFLPAFHRIGEGIGSGFSERFCYDTVSVCPRPPRLDDAEANAKFLAEQEEKTKQEEEVNAGADPQASTASVSHSEEL